MKLDPYLTPYTKKKTPKYIKDISVRVKTIKFL